MEITIEFKCEHCGNLTPVLADLPDGVDARRMVTLAAECFHCGTQMANSERIGRLTDGCRMIGLTDPE